MDTSLPPLLQHPLINRAIIRIISKGNDEFTAKLIGRVQFGAIQEALFMFKAKQEEFPV